MNKTYKADVTIDGEFVTTMNDKIVVDYSFTNSYTQVNSASNITCVRLNEKLSIKVNDNSCKIPAKLYIKTYEDQQDFVQNLLIAYSTGLLK